MATLHQIERGSVMVTGEGSGVMQQTSNLSLSPLLSHLLFPMSMMTILELECCLASSSHVVRCSNVSRLQMESVYKP